MTPRTRALALLSTCGLASMLAACATTAQTPPMTGSNPPVTAQGNAAAAQTLVGQKATAENVELARQRAGADVARVIPPDTMVTMEFREGRLNVYTDAGNAITRITCG